MPSNLIRGPLQYTSTVTLPTVSGAKDNGRTVVIKDGKGDAGTNNITIADPTAQTIDGGANLVISANYGKATLCYDGAGSKWNVIG
jgi:hypothetical protein